MKRLIAIATAALMLLAAPAANAFDPDNFGFSPLNDGAGPAQEAPAMPDVSDAFWAGACDRLGAPPLGQPILPDSGPGAGIGTYNATTSAPNQTEYVQVPQNPASPAHCIEWGVPSVRVQLPWAQAPSWRLPALTQAGGHPDGSTNFAFNRDIGGNIEGSVDNIVAKLPPGFVGDPAAVPKCTAEQFALKPIVCPPETQVGVLQLEIEGVLGGANAPGGLVGGTDMAIYPLYNLEPRRGIAAELGFAYASGEGAVTVRIVGKSRSSSDHGVTFFVAQIPAALQVRSQQVTIWGIPWAAENDAWRAPAGLVARSANPCAKQPGTTTSHYIPPGGLLAPGCAQPYDPAWGPIKPFVSNVTECTGSDLSTQIAIDQYQQPGSFVSDGSPPDPISGKVSALNGDPDLSDPDWRVYEAPAAAITGCEQVGFDPNITLRPSRQGGAANGEADSASGLDVELTVPQNKVPFDPPPSGAPQIDVDQYIADATSYWRSINGNATSHLKDTVVTLPEGMTLNPAAAGGQGVCTTQQIGLTDTDSPQPPAIRFDNAPIACPDSSKVADVVVETPLLEEIDWPEGSVYLAAQGDNPFGSDFAIYIAVESPQRGVIVKLAGKVEPDPNTGRLTTTFVQNPQLPFGKFRLRFKAGPHAPLATPVTCGTHTNVTSLTPYSDPANPRVVNDPFAITGSPAGGCPATPAQRPFSLGFAAGSTELVAGSHSPFTVRLTRGDGNQEFDSVQVATPEGLTAKLAGVPYCSDAAIAAAAARTASGDGRAEQASPSCPAASQVGTTTIGAGAGSQPFFVGGKVYLAGPYKGAPVSLAFIVPAVAGPFDLGVQVVRTALNVNPRTAQVTAVSDTIPKILRGVPLRLRDIRVDIDRPGFTINPTDCAAQLVAGQVFGSHGAVSDVSNRFQVAECARLAFKPRMTLRLRGGTKRGKHPALTVMLQPRPGDANISSFSIAFPRSEFLENAHIRTICTRPDFAADRCPKGAIYGEATVHTPILDYPLQGHLYLRSSDNLLPDVVPDLRGPAYQPIRIESSARTDSIRGGIRNTVDFVPDAPFSKLLVRLQGGKKGLLVNSRDICRRTYRATVEMTAQNGRELTLKPKMQAQCGKGKKKAKRGAHKRGR